MPSGEVELLETETIEEAPVARQLEPHPRKPDEYFQKFRDKPVELKPATIEQKETAVEEIGHLRELLGGIPADIRHRGSTSFGVYGKGDIDIGIYPEKDEDWSKVIDLLKIRYSDPGCLEENYARFNGDPAKDVETVVMRGPWAEVDKKLNEFLAQNQGLCVGYRNVKMEGAGSKRDYQRVKDHFFAAILDIMSSNGIIE